MTDFLRTLLCLLMILATGSGRLCAVDFTTFDFRSNVEIKTYAFAGAAIPGDRYVTVRLADSATVEDSVDFDVVEFKNERVVFVRRFGVYQVDKTGLTDTLPLEVESGGGKAWALLGRKLDGGSDTEYGFVQLYPFGFASFISIGSFENEQRLAMAVGEDGMPRAVLAESTTLSVVQIDSFGQLRTRSLTAAADFFFDGTSIAVKPGQIALTATEFKTLEGGGRESRLWLHQGVEAPFFVDGTPLTKSLVTENASATGQRVAVRQRSAYVSGYLSPVIIYRDEIENVAKLAVRDLSLGWQLENLPSIPGEFIPGAWVDIAADDSGGACLAWYAGQSMAFGRLSSSGVISGEEISSQTGSFGTIDVGPGGEIMLCGRQSATLGQYSILTDVTDIDGNGLNALEEDAFGIQPGSGSRIRLPWATEFVAGDGRRYPAISYWRKLGGVGTHPYVADGIEYYVETSNDLKTWRSEPFFIPFAESFSIVGRGELATYRTVADFETRNGRPTFFRVRVERMK